MGVMQSDFITNSAGKVWYDEATTAAPPPVADWLYIFYNVIVVFLVVFVMTAMGCGISWETVKPHLRRPVGPAIGLACQFVLMPLFCFAMAHLYQLEDTIAIGMVLVGSCPGGVSSNMFTFWCKGDLDLSMTMTLISTVLAVVMMPLNSFLYTRSWTDQKAVIPYTTMVIGILLTWIPAIAGGLIRITFPAFAHRFVRVGSVIAFVILCCTGIIQRFVYPEVFQLPWIVWWAAVTQPLFGMCIGFGMGTLFRRDIHARRTIALETGMQNVGLALALIALSFSGEEASIISQYPILYAALSITDATIIAIAHRSYYRAKGNRTICQVWYYRYQTKKLRGSAGDGTSHVVASDRLPVAGSSYDLTAWMEEPATEATEGSGGWDLGESRAGGEVGTVGQKDVGEQGIWINGVVQDRDTFK